MLRESVQSLYSSGLRVRLTFLFLLAQFLRRRVLKHTSLESRQLWCHEGQSSSTIPWLRFSFALWKSFSTALPLQEYSLTTLALALAILKKMQSSFVRSQMELLLLPGQKWHPGVHVISRHFTSFVLLQTQFSFFYHYLCEVALLESGVTTPHTKPVHCGLKAAASLTLSQGDVMFSREKN